MNELMNTSVQMFRKNKFFMKFDKNFLKICRSFIRDELIDEFLVYLEKYYFISYSLNLLEKSID